MHPQDEDTSGSSALERRLREVLDDSAERLDGRTRSRLTQARHAALAQLQARPAAQAWRSWAPAGVAATAVLATLLYVGQRQDGTPVIAPGPAAGGAVEDLELLADADALALTSDLEADLDYEFYEWAAAAAEGDSGLGS